SSTLGRPLNDKVSSIQFLSALARQAGVIVYKDANFGGFHEIFIASDANLTDSILGKEDEISSLQIIGKYRVTLYDGANFSIKDAKGNETAWLRLDNTDPANPKEDHSPQLSSGGGHEGSTNNIFRISDFAKYCFLEPGKNVCTRETFSDKISSIKIEVPDEISADQKLGGACKDNFCTL
ncbi:MAG: hypothetical protein HYZ69_00245, partial [Candidatus Colwellbacteria bacterium]|nr:hypothetical protein [Candidatus Colwellbacteria bacterium]